MLSGAIRMARGAYFLVSLLGRGRSDDTRRQRRSSIGACRRWQIPDALRFWNAPKFGNKISEICSNRFKQSQALPYLSFLHFCHVAASPWIGPAKDILVTAEQLREPGQTTLLSKCLLQEEVFELPQGSWLSHPEITGHDSAKSSFIDNTKVFPIPFGLTPLNIDTLRLSACSSHLWGFIEPGGEDPLTSDLKEG